MPARTSRGVERIPDLVSERCLLRARMKEDGKRCEEIDAVLFKSGAGRYTGLRDEQLLVVFPGPGLETPRDEKDLAALRGDILGDADFKTLFERVVSWRPVKSCRDIAVRILTPMQLKKFLVACEVPSQPQVRFS